MSCERLDWFWTAARELSLQNSRFSIVEQNTSEDGLAS